MAKNRNREMEIREEVNEQVPEQESRGGHSKRHRGFNVKRAIGIGAGFLTVIVAGVGTLVVKNRRKKKTRDYIDGCGSEGTPLDEEIEVETEVTVEQ